MRARALRVEEASSACSEDGREDSVTDTEWGGGALEKCQRGNGGFVDHPPWGLSTYNVLSLIWLIPTHNSALSSSLLLLEDLPDQVK